MSTLKYWIFAAALVHIPVDAAAVEALSAQDLILHCKGFPSAADSGNDQYCLRYIQGFIDGAVVTDVRVMLNVEAALDRKETFRERATRTRSSSVRRRASEYAEFCLGEPVPLREVVEKVVADLHQRSFTADNLEARDVVYGSLRKHYPCKKAGTP